MACDEIGAVALEITAGLPDHFEIADHGVLSDPTLQKRALCEARGVTLNPLDRLHDVTQIVGRSGFTLAHTG